MHYSVESNDLVFEFNKEDVDNVQLVKLNPQVYHYIEDNHCYEFEVLDIDHVTNQIIVLLNKEKFHFKVSGTLQQLIDQMGLNMVADNSLKELKAPMPGLIIDVLVKEGDEVQKNQNLVILEAMKMENILKSEGEGIVKKLTIKKGDTVEKHQVLLELE